MLMDYKIIVNQCRLVKVFRHKDTKAQSGTKDITTEAGRHGVTLFYYFFFVFLCASVSLWRIITIEENQLHQKST